MELRTGKTSYLQRTGSLQSPPERIRDDGLARTKITKNPTCRVWTMLTENKMRQVGVNPELGYSLAMYFFDVEFTRSLQIKS